MSAAFPALFQELRPVVRPTQRILHRVRELPAHCLQQLRWLDFADWQAAKLGKHVLLKPDECARSVPPTHLSGMNGRVPHARHRFEAIDHKPAATRERLGRPR